VRVHSLQQPYCSPHAGVSSLRAVTHRSLQHVSSGQRSGRAQGVGGYSEPVGALAIVAGEQTGGGGSTDKFAQTQQGRRRRGMSRKRGRESSAASESGGGPPARQSTHHKSCWWERAGTGGTDNFSPESAPPLLPGPKKLPGRGPASDRAPGWILSGTGVQPGPVLSGVLSSRPSLTA
jgi:hypothetical protein